jgi:hypothetical protein
MAYGLRPVKTNEGGSSGVVREYVIADSYAVDVFQGDFVELVTAGTVERQNGATGESPIIANPTLGAATGFSYTDGNGASQWASYYPAAGTNVRVTVADDPRQLFSIVGSAAVTQAMVGASFEVTTFASSSGNTQSGQSGITLDVSSAGTDAGTVRLVEIPQDGSNESSSTPVVIVRLMENVSQNDRTAAV